MSEPRPKVATHEGVPHAQIQDAQTKWEHVVVRMHRRVAGGKLAALGNKQMTLGELSDIENYVRECAGGGIFRIEPRNPQDLLSYADPIPPFTIEIDGPPKPSNAFEHTGSQMPFAGGIARMSNPSGMHIPPEALAQIPSWVRPEHRAAWLAASDPVGVAAANGLPMPAYDPHMPRAAAPAAAFSSDQLAVKQLDELRAEVAADRARAAQREKALTEELERSRKDIEKHKDEERSLREKGEREVLKLQLESLRAELQVIRATPPPAPPPARPAIPVEAWIGLVGALAPVLTAVVTSGSTRQASMAEQQAKVAELQMAGLSTVLGAANNKKSDLSGLAETLLKVAPLAVPLFTEFFKNKSPAAQANLFSTLMENNLTTLSTMGSFLQSMLEMQGGDPWWRPMVENGIQGVVAAAQQYSEMAVKQNGGTVANEQAKPPARQASPGTTMATMIVNNPQFPKELKNGAWVEVIAALHDKAPPPNVAEFVTEELVAMRDKNALPEIFAQVFEMPEQAVAQLIAFLPIYKADRPYADAVIQAIGQAVRATTVVETKGEPAGDDDDGDDDEPAARPPAVPFNLNAARGNARVPVPA
jgi:hypothetical protein